MELQQTIKIVSFSQKVNVMLSFDQFIVVAYLIKQYLLSSHDSMGVLQTLNNSSAVHSALLVTPDIYCNSGNEEL